MPLITKLKDIKKIFFLGAVIGFIFSVCSGPTFQKIDAIKILSKKYDKDLFQTITLSDEFLYSRLKNELKDSSLVANGYVVLAPYSLAT